MADVTNVTNVTNCDESVYTPSSHGIKSSQNVRNRKRRETDMTTSTPVAADVAAKAQKELAAAITKARKAYSAKVTPIVTAARIERDKSIADAYHTFSEATGQTA